MPLKPSRSALLAVSVVAVAITAYACSRSGTNAGDLTGGDAARKVYVAPGEKDELYAFMSGGFSGQVSVYGIPSGRLLKVIPVFSQNPENGWGYTEESKPMLNTTFGFIPWDDSHHTELSMTDGSPDGRWLFINGNNTPRIARIDLTRFETEEIIQIPNAAGGHASPFATPDNKYVVSATRFSVPIPNTDQPIGDYKKSFRGTLSFINADQPGKMDIAFQILMPGYDYDLGHAGKGPSAGWFFFTSYNSEQANTKLETNASQNDKDFIAAVNYKLAESCVADGKAKATPSEYVHNVLDVKSHIATSETKHSGPHARPGATALPASCTSCPRRSLLMAWISIPPVNTSWPAASSPASILGAFLHEVRQGHPGQGVREGDRRHSGHPLCRRHRRRGAEAGTRPVAHGIRRQGLRVHLDVHLIRGREVEARHMGSR